MSFHKTLDLLREKKAGSKKIGTTGRGIGPAYEDRVGRRAIRLCDIFDKKILKKKIENALFHHNPIRKGLGINEIQSNEIIKQIDEIASYVKPFVTNVWEKLINLQNQNKNILYEGAQGVLLDVDHGTYPFVTSSNTVSAQSSIGSGVGNIKKSYTLGITKAYATRVGAGPMPTELFDSVGEHLAVKGQEVGTTTGRGRRCGWFDAVAVRHAIEVNSISGICLTKLDVLDGLSEVKVCVAYELPNGGVIDYLPSGDDFWAAKPIYETMPGWSDSTFGTTSLDEMPLAAKDYLQRLGELVGAPIDIVSTGPDREQTIVITTPFGVD